MNMFENPHNMVTITQYDAKSQGEIRAESLEIHKKTKTLLKI